MRIETYAYRKPIGFISRDVARSTQMQMLNKVLKATVSQRLHKSHYQNERY